MVLDVKQLAERGYLGSVNIVLCRPEWLNEPDTKMRCFDQRSGMDHRSTRGNLRPMLSGGSLNVILSYTRAWMDLPGTAKQNFKSGLQVL